MDMGSYRPRPNPQAGITRIVFGNKPTAETEGEECSSPCDGFGRPLLMSSEDDIITEVPRKGSNRTAIDIIRDSQATAKSSTYVPKAFVNWSTITAGPKVSVNGAHAHAIWFVLMSRDVNAVLPDTCTTSDQGRGR